MADDALTNAEQVERWADNHFSQGEVAVVMRLYSEFGWRPAEAVDAALARIKHLPDEWERYSNEVSKFIDQEHADDLRAALAAVKEGKW